MLGVCLYVEVVAFYANVIGRRLNLIAQLID